MCQPLLVRSLKFKKVCVIVILFILNIILSIAIISSADPGNVEEEEVLKLIRECLDLREKYVYREEIAPWMKETISESKASDKKHDPFSFGHFEASSVSCDPQLIYDRKGFDF